MRGHGWGPGDGQNTCHFQVINASPGFQLKQQQQMCVRALRRRPGGAQTTWGSGMEVIGGAVTDLAFGTTEELCEAERCAVWSPSVGRAKVTPQIRLPLFRR